VTSIFVALEVGGSRLAAEVAIDALVVAVVSACDILGILVGYVSHSEKRLKAPDPIATVFSRRVAKTCGFVRILP